MPESKHHKKKRSHSEWRKARNKRRANHKWASIAEKRGMEKALKIMQEQFESEKELLDEPDPKPLKEE